MGFQSPGGAQPAWPEPGPPFELQVTLVSTRQCLISRLDTAKLAVVSQAGQFHRPTPMFSLQGALPSLLLSFLAQLAAAEVEVEQQAMEAQQAAAPSNSSGPPYTYCDSDCQQQVGLISGVYAGCGVPWDQPLTVPCCPCAGQDSGGADPGGDRRHRAHGGHLLHAGGGHPHQVCHAQGAANAPGVRRPCSPGVLAGWRRVFLLPFFLPTFSAASFFVSSFFSVVYSV